MLKGIGDRAITAIGLDGEGTGGYRVYADEGVDKRSRSAFLKGLPEAIFSVFCCLNICRNAARIRVYCAAFL